jgi:SAM-dependent methyltransferase
MRWDVVIGLLDSPRLGAELGAHSGKFTEQLLSAFPRLTMYAIDTWCIRPMYETYDFPDVRKQFAKRTRVYGYRVKTLHMDTLEAAAHVADGSLDFVFIDADHSYEAVAADIDAWKSKVKPGGVLCGHDYGHPRFPGVKLAVDERLTVSTGDDHVWWVRC